MNWKLFGITIYNVTIIPCYYDLLRYRQKLIVFAIKHLNIIRFSTIFYRYQQLFNTNLKPL